MSMIHASEQPAYQANPAARPEFDVSDIVVTPLHGAAEIASVLHLRDEIDLSVHTRGGVEQFLSLEKKEMNSGWWSVSTWTESASAPSASSLSAWA
ncbi:hypothetical protein [Ramlibacter albus]|uniref:Uncharacterized protein n=1 Tax=Ramlibacter albus TaxID=2079448 RepID=A0A923M580_9BURK|nr:hypothetical protein [Ramlibacter albus]MBC5764427.1 hypothetical protein [Ramlibacter albus]